MKPASVKRRSRSARQGGGEIPPAACLEMLSPEPSTESLPSNLQRPPSSDHSSSRPKVGSTPPSNRSTRSKEGCAFPVDQGLVTNPDVQDQAYAVSTPPAAGPCSTGTCQHDVSAGHASLQHEGSAMSVGSGRFPLDKVFFTEVTKEFPNREEVNNREGEEGELGAAASEGSLQSSSSSLSISSGEVAPQNLQSKGTAPSGGVAREEETGQDKGIAPPPLLALVQQLYLHEEQEQDEAREGEAGSRSFGGAHSKGIVSDVDEVTPYRPVGPNVAAPAAGDSPGEKQVTDGVDHSPADAGTDMSGDMLEVQLQRQLELRGNLSRYIDDLWNKTWEERDLGPDDDGEGKGIPEAQGGTKLVDLPRNYLLMVEQMMREKRSEYRVLQDWLGPRHFETLPVSQLPTTHPDPLIEEGLKKIRELDEKLKEKLLEAALIERETFPEKYGDHERKRLEEFGQHVEELLKRERKKRLHVSRLARAVMSLDEGLATAEYDAKATKMLYSRYVQLSPEEELVVERILNKTEEKDEAANPFELAVDQLGDDRLSIADIEGRLSELYGEIQSVGEDRAEVQSTGGRSRSSGPCQSSASQGTSRAISKARDVASQTSGASMQKDYLREQRTARDLMAREQEVDRQLAELRSSELPPRLAPQQLQELIAICRREQESTCG